MEHGEEATHRRRWLVRTGRREAIAASTSSIGHPPSSGGDAIRRRAARWPRPTPIQGRRDGALAPRRANVPLRGAVGGAPGSSSARRDGGAHDRQPQQQPGTHARGRARDGQVDAVGAAGRGDLGNLDQHDPGYGRHDRGSHQVLVELCFLSGRGAAPRRTRGLAPLRRNARRADRPVRGDHSLSSRDPGHACEHPLREGDDCARVDGADRVLHARPGFNVIGTANMRDRGVNEMSSALNRGSTSRRSTRSAS